MLSPGPVAPLIPVNSFGMRDTVPHRGKLKARRASLSASLAKLTTVNPTLPRGTTLRSVATLDARRANPP